MTLRPVWFICGLLPWFLDCQRTLPTPSAAGDPTHRLAGLDAAPPAPPASSASGCRASPGAAPIAATDTELRARAIKIQHRLSRLNDEVMTFWKTKGPDAQFGGFHGNLDRLGAPSTPTDKGLIQQTRHLWSFSNWYDRREPTAEIEAIANREYRFILDHYFDAASRQYHFEVDQSGTKVVDARKVLYAESFALYAFATYGRVFSSAEARQRALDLFRSIDARHDPINLGYDEHNDSGWLQGDAQKSTNTHIHLMESFTALYEATQDPVVRERLEELVRVVRTKIFQIGKGYDAKEFTNEWTPVGSPHVSYGHDLETAWLLWHAGCVLGRPDDEEIRHAALGMGLSSAAQGYDPVLGGYFEEGIPQVRVTGTDKIWWVEAEALPSLWMLYRLSGDKSLLDRLEGTLSFIETKQRDNQNPGTEWFWGIARNGEPNARGDHKGEEWKASYHNSRALTLTAAWIADALR